MNSSEKFIKLVSASNEWLQHPGITALKNFISLEDESYRLFDEGVYSVENLDVEEILCQSIVNQGRMYSFLQLYEDALEEYKRVYQDYSSSSESSLIFQVVRALVNGGVAASLKGDNEQAVDLWERAVSFFNKKQNKINRAVLQSFFNLITLYQDTGDEEKAEDTKNQMFSLYRSIKDPEIQYQILDFVFDIICFHTEHDVSAMNSLYLFMLGEFATLRKQDSDFISLSKGYRRLKRESRRTFFSLEAGKPIAVEAMVGKDFLQINYLNTRDLEYLERWLKKNTKPELVLGICKHLRIYDIMPFFNLFINQSFDTLDLQLKKLSTYSYFDKHKEFPAINSWRPLIKSLSFDGHTKGVIKSVSFDRWIVSGGMDGRLCLWNVDTGLLEEIFETGLRISNLFVAEDRVFIFFWQSLKVLELNKAGELESWEKNHLFNMPTYIKGINGIACLTETNDLKLFINQKQIWEKKGPYFPIMCSLGKFIAIILQKNFIEVYSSDIDKQILNFNLKELRISAITFIDNGLFLICAGIQGDVFEINLKTAKIHKLKDSGIKGEVSLNSFKDDFVVSNAKGICLYKNKMPHLLTEKGEGASSIAITEDYLVAGMKDQSIKVWRLEPLSFYVNLHGHIDRINSFEFISQHQFVSCSLDKTLRVWDLKRKSLKFLLGNSPVLSQKLFGSCIAVLHPGLLRIWNYKEQKLLVQISGGDSFITAYDIGPFDTIVCGNQEGRLVIYKDGKSKTIAKSHNQLLVLLAGTGGLGFAGYKDGTIICFSLDEAKILWSIKPHSAAVRTLREYQKTLFSGSDDRNICGIVPQTGLLLYTLEKHTGSVVSLCYEKESETIVSGGEDGLILQWKNDKMISVIKDDKIPVREVILNGNLLLARIEDRDVLLWELPDTQTATKLSGHRSRINSAVLMPEGRFLATSSRDKAVRIWGLPDGEIIRRIPTESDAETVVSGSADCNIIAYGGNSGVVIVMDFSIYDKINFNLLETHKIDDVFLADYVNKAELDVQQKDFLELLIDLKAGMNEQK